MIDRISVLGTGLIGGSLGLAWQERRPDCTIVGHDRPEVLDAAAARGAIDQKAADPVTAVESADLVVLATPLATILKLLDTIADHVPEGAFITDVGSVKQPVLDQAEDVLPDHAQFLGGHPMAGAEQGGIEHADPLLFENAVYALCQSNAGDEDALNDFAPVVDLVEATGARPLPLAPDRHDRLVAAVSHLPQLVAVALVNTVAESDDAPTAANLPLELAGGGFRDMTRIAASPFEMWRDVLVGNEGNIHDVMSEFRRTLRGLRNRLIEGDLNGLEEVFSHAQQARGLIPGDAKGFLDSVSDVQVRAPDEPGVLHDLTGHLADAELNVKDIELQTVREGTGGTFRLAFADATDADAAVEALRTADYDAWRPE